MHITWWLGKCKTAGFCFSSKASTKRIVWVFNVQTPFEPRESEICMIYHCKTPSRAYLAGAQSKVFPSLEKVWMKRFAKIWMNLSSWIFSEHLKFETLAFSHKKDLWCRKRKFMGPKKEAVPKLKARWNGSRPRGRKLQIVRQQRKNRMVCWHKNSPITVFLDVEFLISTQMSSWVKRST